eukprot:3584170-Heterocapsa_arctica.AAC.1
MDTSERSLVTQKYGYDETAQGIVKTIRDGVLSLYVTDVWNLLKGEGALLRIACEHIPVEKRKDTVFIVTNGSPCQDLISVSFNGTAGFAGNISVHFH